MSSGPDSVDIFFRGFYRLNYFYFYSIPILLQFLFALLLVYFVKSKTSSPGIRKSFLLFLAVSMLWSVLALLNRYPDFSDSARLLLARGSLFTFFILAFAFVYFSFLLAGIWTEMSRKPSFLFLQGLNAVFMIGTLTRWSIIEIHYDSPLMKASFGLFYYATIIFLTFYGFYVFFVLIKSYLKQKDDLIRIQLKYILYSSAVMILIIQSITAMLTVFFNGVLNIPVGQISVMLLLVAISYILMKGKFLLVNESFRELRNYIAKNNSEDLLGLKHLLNNMLSEISNQSANIKSLPVDLSLQKGNKNFLKVIFEKTQDDMRKNFAYRELISDGLMPAAGKGLLSERQLLPDLENYNPDDYRTLIEANSSYTAAFFGEQLLCFSKEYYNLMLKVIRYSSSRFPVVFTGESGTGRSTLARALHFYRGADNIIANFLRRRNLLFYFQ